MAKILVVDDRLSSRQLLTTLLGYFDHELFEASDGAEGLELATLNRPDLVIADLLMPTMDGFELVRQLRSKPATAVVKVIFYTASYLEKEARLLADSCGVSHILMKPSDPEVILKTIDEVLGQSESAVPAIQTDEFHEYHLKLVTGKLIEKLENVIPRLSALIELGKELGAERDPLRMVEMFCHAARDLIGSKYAAVSLYAEDEQTITHFFTSGMSPTEAARIGAYPVGLGLLSNTLATNSPLRIIDIGSDPRSVGFPPNHPQMHSFLTAPIRTSVRRYGSFYFTEKIGTVAFTQEDEEVAATLAAQIGVAYENALRYDELQREVAEREQAQEALRASEERFRIIFERSIIGQALIAPDGTLLEVNQAFAELLGYSIEEARRLNFATITDPMDAETSRERVRILLANEATSYRMELRLIHKNGSTIWADVSATLVREKSGLPRYFITGFADITARKHAEAALRDSEERHRTLFENVPIGLFRVSKDGQILTANPAAVQMFAYPDLPSLINAGMGAMFDSQEALQQWETAIAERETVQEFEAMAKRYDGRLIWAVGSGRAVRDRDGRVEYYEGSVLDITRRKQAEDELKALYNALSPLYGANDLINLSRQIVQAAVREFGTVDCGLVLMDKDRIRMIRMARAGEYHVDTGAPLAMESTGLIPAAVRTGTLVYAPDVTVEPNYLANDPRTRSELVVPLQTAQGVIGVLDLQSPHVAAFSERDQRIISAFAERVAVVVENMQLYEEINRRAAELEWRVAERTAQLNQTKERVEAILSNSSDAIIVVGLDGTIVNTNPAFHDLFGYQPDRVFNQPVKMLFAVDEGDRVTEAVQSVVGGQPTVRIEIIGRHVDGPTFYADTSFSPIKREGDALAGVVCSVRDITVRRNMEEELRAALVKEKELNELKSRFVSMVSHEFRTPLSTILTSTELVSTYGDRMTPERKRGHFTTVQSQVHQLTRLLEDVLMLGKADSVGLEFRPVPLDLAATCRNLVEDVQHSVGIPHQILMTISEDACSDSRIDEKLLRHIVSNLLSNAMKYSPEGSSVHLDVTCADGWATIRVRDEGIGIPEEDQARLFESFHRARNVGTVSGTGLGLAIIKRAVEAHRGTISFESKEGVGTTFSVALPITHHAES